MKDAWRVFLFRDSGNRISACAKMKAKNILFPTKIDWCLHTTSRRDMSRLRREAEKNSSNIFKIFFVQFCRYNMAIRLVDIKIIIRLNDIYQKCLNWLIFVVQFSFVPFSNVLIIFSSIFISLSSEFCYLGNPTSKDRLYIDW